MPVSGPDYDKDSADRIGKEIYEHISNKYRLLNSPPPPFFKDGSLRKELQEDCNQLAHKFLRYDSYESF